MHLGCDFRGRMHFTGTDVGHVNMVDSALGLQLKPKDKCESDNVTSLNFIRLFLMVLKESEEWVWETAPK